VTAVAAEVLDVVRDGRALPTHLHLPAAAPPWPLVAFAHGWMGHPRKFTRLFDRWAAAGIAVAAPAFPHTSDASRDPDFDDVVNQPADVRCVLDRLLEDGRVDACRVAVAGFSLGAMTALAVAFSRSRPDPRVRAVVSISGRLPSFEPHAFRSSPLLVVHGEHDEIVEYAAGLDVYRRALPPKALLTITVPGHHEYVEDDPPTEADPVVRDVTAAFFGPVLSSSSPPKPAVEPLLGRLESDGIW
jgi:predicted dienelactone hydrolase